MPTPIYQLILKSDRLISTPELGEKNEYGMYKSDALIAELTTALSSTLDPLMRAAYHWGDEDTDNFLRSVRTSFC